MKRNINYNNTTQSLPVRFKKNKTRLVGSASVVATLIVGVLGYVLFWIITDSRDHPKEMPDGIGIGIIIFVICSMCAVIHSIAVFGLTDPALLPKQFEESSRWLVRMQSILYAPTIGCMLLPAGPSSMRSIIIGYGILYMAIYPASLGKALAGVACIINNKKYNIAKVNIKSILCVLIFFLLQGLVFVVNRNLDGLTTCSVGLSLLWCLCVIWVFHFGTRLVQI